MNIRKATVNDAKLIHDLIKRFAKKYDMLPRSLNEIYENIRDFYIYIDNDTIVAAAALHILWEDLAEVRSVAVSKEYQGIGVGKKLVRQCMKEAKKLGVNNVFALTYAPEFFTEIGFEEVDKNTLPQKIWGECLKCHKFPECDESAVMISIKN
ncbi:MAG TPA: N-acetyltransferase [Nitrospirae bacterium]|nr:amino-acid acetyltransferase [bacterium BMS3Abin09]GBE41674.1 amino-acid acetyltransferase [bacterium BMS3Bbin09]HDH33954.1 N-acetyltransferase [Nitrospirota bacterium]HDO67023.1 N-acetyltransferase [Nitrospirota bacterium]HDZ84294.1 N-acetyltransferase [Nitrospirota bacterium]